MLMYGGKKKMKKREKFNGSSQIVRPKKVLTASDMKAQSGLSTIGERVPS